MISCGYRVPLGGGGGPAFTPKVATSISVWTGSVSKVCTPSRQIRLTGPGLAGFPGRMGGDGLATTT